MEQRPLGRIGPQVSALGLGCMGMSGMYGPADRAESLATIATAVERGVTLLDTGDFYGMGHNEMLIGEALRSLPRDRLQISVKFGALRDPENGWSGYDSRRAAIRNFLAFPPASAPTTSTSTAPHGSTPPSPSRRRWAPWPRW
ncbi:aldo/keto reductase [Roseomonas sp. GCM10028921]